MKTRLVLISLRFLFCNKTGYFYIGPPGNNGLPGHAGRELFFLTVQHTINQFISLDPGLVGPPGDIGEPGPPGKWSLD